MIWFSPKKRQLQTGQSNRRIQTAINLNASGQSFGQVLTLPSGRGFESSLWYKHFLQQLTRLVFDPLCTDMHLARISQYGNKYLRLLKAWRSNWLVDFSNSQVPVDPTPGGSKPSPLFMQRRAQALKLFLSALQNIHATCLSMGLEGLRFVTRTCATQPRHRSKVRYQNLRKAGLRDYEMLYVSLYQVERPTNTKLCTSQIGRVRYKWK